MRFGLVAVVGLTVAGMSGAAAQQANTPSAMPATVEQVQPRYAVVGVGCPGVLQARQQATGGGTVWTTALEDEHDDTARPGGLGIHVDFAGVKTAVKSLELRVSYMPLGLRRVPVAPETTNAKDDSPQERAKTFNLDREAAMKIGGDLLVGPAATITRVRLISVTYADGSVWHPSSEDVCSVEPSKYMLVEAKR
jgi:hypothetical protein